MEVNLLRQLMLGQVLYARHQLLSTKAEPCKMMHITGPPTRWSAAECQGQAVRCTRQSAWNKAPCRDMLPKLQGLGLHPTEA